jgi:DNA-binding response OmpR family regulator/ligand-binding sensor domain-containing protein/nitrogen-specific signal transduction histidine kinase
MNIRIKYHFILSFLILIHFSGFSQLVKRLDTKEGLINGTINVFEKDSLGYIWIGSDKGLNRYSGVEIKKYDLEEITSIESTGILEILNLNGDLYMISQNGYLIKYLYEVDKFEEVLHLEKKRFLSLARLNNQQLLIGLDAGFIIYDITSKKTSKILQPDTFINRKILIKNNLIYSATARGCLLYTFDKKNNSLLLKEKILEKNDIINIALDTKNRLWIGTEVGGLFVKNDTEIKKVFISELQRKTYAIRKIKFDNQGNALVSIDRLGLFIIDKDFQIKKSFSHDVDDSNSISQNSIYEIFVDYSNAYWLGLREGGINIIYQKDNVFNQISHVLNTTNSINNNNIRSIFETKNGDLWLGTENGISKFSNQKWTNYSKNPKLYNTAVLAINEYKNNLLLGTYGEGLLTLNKNDGSLTDPKLEPKVPLQFIFEIAVFDDNLWISGSDGPLLHYYQNKLIGNYAIGLVRSIVQGYDEINYAGTMTGFFEINKRNKSTRKIKEDIFNNLNEIQDLNLDYVNNCIWIGSTNGLYKFNLSNETIENIGLNSNKEIGTVFSVKKDNIQNLYLGTISGLWRYDIKNKLFRKYNAQDGLQIKEFGVSASTKLNDGSLAFGGPEGAVIFQPLDLEKDEPISDIYISNFQINGKKPDGLTLAKNINYLDEIELNFDQNSISFNFETIKFHGSKRNNFEWKLKGYDKDFRNIYGNEKITYSNLKSGNYSLYATGFNADGLKSKSKHVLNIKIKKPFWKTATAISLYIILLGLFIYLIYRVSKANTRKRTDEDRIKFFIEVAHDIRTPVSLIQLLVKQLSNQENTKKSIELIQRNTENLNEYVTQLLDFQKIDRNQLKLSVSKVDLKDCLTDIVKDFTPILQEKSLDIQLNLKNISVWFDKVKMKRIFYNMISNAIKYSDEGGQIEIKAFSDKENLKIEFIDTGMGIPEKQQDLVFKRFTRGTNVSNKGIPGTGIGLMLSKKIVELHGGKILLESKENVGSKFTIILPNGSQHYNSNEFINEININSKQTNIDNLIHENKLILLVEDNEELRKAIKIELDKSYTVIEAANGKEGLLIALSKSPDLIITDVMMPEMNGKELCNLLKTNFKTSHIPIIMLTALVDVDDKLQGLETGADAYVEKPFNTEILKITIHNLIKSRENINRLLEDKEIEKQLTPDERFLSDIIELIKNNLTAKDFSIDNLCEQMGLSRSNLFRKLKGLIQMSPSDLIVKIKLSHAEELMKQKVHIRISDIAYESGFHDPKYFSTLFKKHYNQTPKEFIENI